MVAAKSLNEFPLGSIMGTLEVWSTRSQARQSHGNAPLVSDWT